MILEKLKEIFKNINPEIDSDSITKESDLALDLGLDSVSMLMLAFMIEEEFGFRFDDAVTFKTVREVCEYIEKAKQ